MIDNKYILRGTEITKDLDIIDFDINDGSFFINKKHLNMTDYSTIALLVDRLRWDKEFRFDCTVTKIKDIAFGFHDKCLQNYCYEMINLNYAHKDTCWFKNAEKTYVLTLWEENKPFEQKEKIHFIQNLKTDTFNPNANKINALLKRELRLNRNNALDYLVKTDDNWIVFYSKLPLRELGLIPSYKRVIKDKIKSLIKYNNYERIVNIANNIKLKGWVEDLAWQTPGTVLLKSEETGLYQTWTGRHRINALKYLHNQKLVDDEITVNYPVIKHRLKRLIHSVSHPKRPICDECEFSKSK